MAFSHSYSQVLDPANHYQVEELPQVRASDVMWHRRLWREIDLTEKVNQHLYYPPKSENRNYALFDLLFHQLKKGVIKAYGIESDDFKKELSMSEIIGLTTDTLLVNGKIVTQEVDGKDIVKLWLKEDWFYNSKYSRIEVRIIGLCPVRIKKDRNGNILGYQQLVWFYFPHIRHVLVNYEALKKQQADDPRVSFDDVFVKLRKFNSYIILNKVDQLEKVRENKTELDVLLENQETKVYLFNEKTMLWE